MPDLAKIASTINSLAPTTLYQYVVKNYMANDKLMNLLPFVNQGGQLMQGSGTFQVNITSADKPIEAVEREAFEEPDPNNNETKTTTLTLKEIAQVFSTDATLQRVTSSGSIMSWEAFQLEQAVTSVVNKFNYNFINGDNTTNNKQFDGLMTYFKKHTDQAENTAYAIDVLTHSNALEIEQFLDYCMSKVRGGATAILTTRLGGASFLRALESYRNRGIVTVDVNSVKYNTFMGVPIIGLEKEVFAPDVLEKGIPFIFIHTDERMDGIRVITPAVGPVINIIRPGQEGGTSGVFTKRGGVNIVCVPVFVDPYCASIAYIKQARGPGNVAGGNA